MEKIGSLDLLVSLENLLVPFLLRKFRTPAGKKAEKTRLGPADRETSEVETALIQSVTLTLPRRGPASKLRCPVGKHGQVASSRGGGRNVATRKSRSKLGFGQHPFQASRFGFLNRRVRLPTFFRFPRFQILVFEDFACRGKRNRVTAEPGTAASWPFG